MITITFENEKELHRFIQENMPFAIKPQKKSKFPFINPFSSLNARTICATRITESLITKSKNN